MLENLKLNVLDSYASAYENALSDVICNKAKVKVKIFFMIVSMCQLVLNVSLDI